MSEITLLGFVAHVKTMRELQQAYFDAHKATRWPDKKILAASKAKEEEVDDLIRTIMQPTPIKAQPAEQVFKSEIKSS